MESKSWTSNNGEEKDSVARVSEVSRPDASFLDLIRKAPFGVFLIDDDFRLVEYSAGCDSVFAGIDPLIGRDLTEVLSFTWPEQAVTVAVGRFRHTLVTGEPYHSFDTTSERIDIPAVESYEWKLERVTLSDGRFGVVCYFYQTTDRVRAERDADFLSSLAERCRTANDAASLLGAAIRETGAHLGLDRCFVNEIFENEDRWAIRDDYYSESCASLVGDYKLSDYDSALIQSLKAGVIEVVTDGKADPRIAPRYEPAYKPLGIRAQVAVPLLREGRWIATFVSTSNTPRPWSEREVGLLKTIAELIWSAVERRRFEEGLRDSRVQLDTALKAGRMGSWQLILHSNDLVCSESCKANFGRQPGEELTLPEIAAAVHPEDRERWNETVRAAIANCSDFEIEYRTIWPDESVRWISVRGNCYAGPTGEAVSLAGITVDITDRKTVEHQLIERSEFKQEVIDSLAAHISVLDRNGVITAVNNAWRRFARENGADWTMRGVGVGVNYLDICHDSGEADAQLIYAGIRDVLERRRDVFTFEYPCHSPTAQRWFLLSVSALEKDGGAVVSHTNITERRLAEEALRNSQDRFEIVKEGAEIGFWFCDLPFDELIWDARVKEHFWLPHDARVTIDTFYEQIHPDDRERTRATIAESIANKTRYQIDYRTVSPEGEVKWIRALGRTFYDLNGEPKRFDGVTLDITERRRAENRLRESEERFRFLDSLAVATRTADDPAAVMMIAARMLGEHLGVTRCAYADVDSDNDRFVIRDDWRIPGAATTAGVYSLDLFGTRAAAELCTGELLVVCNVDAELTPADGADMFNAIGIKSIITAPLVKEGTLRAMMAVHNALPRDWTPDEVALVREVAERSWAHIERVGASAALAESEERFRTLFESIDEGFGVIEVEFDDDGNATDYRFIQANRAFEEHTGMLDVLGRSAKELYPELEEFWFETYGRVALTGETVRFENYAEPMKRWFNVYASKVGAETSRRVALVFANITERKQAEEALRESEARFRNMADNAPVMIWVTEPDGMCTYLSQSWYEFTGQTPETGLGLGWVGATHPDDNDKAEQAFLAANAKQEAFRVEYRLRRADGQYRWAIDSAQPRFGPGGEFMGYVGSVIDIDERKESEELLRRTNEKLQMAWSDLRATYDQSPIGLAQLDTDLRYVRINEQLAAMNGISAADHLGRTIHEIVPDLAPKVEAILHEVIETGQMRRDLEVEGETAAQPGVMRTWLESWFPMQTADGRIVGVNVIAQDITDRKVAEKALRDRELLESAVKFQEAERRRIARDLHDQLGQQLTGLRLTLADLCDKSVDVPEIRDKVLKAQENALALDKDVSSLAFELRANILNEQNLAEALGNFVAEWSRNYDIRGEFELLNHVGEADLPGEIETNLYRIAQEALNNATKHAQASHVSVILEIRSDSVRLIVEDDGVGFDPKVAAQAMEHRRDGHGLGLIGMRERVDLLRGSLEIDSTSGQGTTVFVTLPL